MPQPTVAKAVLIPMNADRVETDTSKHIVVQFNPASLRVTLTNNLKANAKDGDQTAAQYIGKGESSLSVELLFDTTVAHDEIHHQITQDARPNPSSRDPLQPSYLGDESGSTRVEANSDVRLLTKRIAEAFMNPQGASSKHPRAPRRCRFQWGSFQFTGMLASYNETLDFFAPEGIPLRATLALSFKEDRYQFQINDQVKAGERQAPTFAPGGQGISADRATQAAGGDPRNWRDTASFNGLENPRFTPASGLSLPAEGQSASALAAPYTPGS